MKRNFEISLDFNKSEIINKTLNLFFIIIIINYSDKKIDKKYISQEIKKAIPKIDEKYIKIKKYNNKEVVFIFDTNEWFNEVSKIKDTENRYVKRLILKKVPLMILNNINAIEYTRIIEQSFRNYILKNKQLKDRITNSVAKDLPLAYYKFRYEGNLNAIKIEVKEEFRHNIIAVLRSKQNPRKELKKMDFDSSVETYLKLNKSR